MKALFKALANFQQEVPILHKDTQGYGYSYTDLPEILRTINPLLKKHGLGFIQPLNGNELKTVVFHYESGESIESTVIIPEDSMKGMNKYQSLGSGITYMRRYALSSFLGLVTDKDIDGSTIEDKVSLIENTEDLTELFKKLNKAQQEKFKPIFTERRSQIINKK
ncbi:MAG: hypothetical protein EKK57_03830 [Proteobacteria bacterium]|nr:MAG: hypothetical protein EKK57_03830 [Pseudomonadota bacterium]